MHLSPFLFVLQGALARTSAEQAWNAVQRAVGAPLNAHLIPKAGILILTQSRKQEARQATFSTLDVADADSGAGSRLAILVPSGTHRNGAEAEFPGKVLDGLWLGSSSVGSGSSRAAVDVEYDFERRIWRIKRGPPGLNSIYYRRSRDEGVCFAASTQLRALLPCLSPGRPKLDQVALSRFLSNGFFCEPETPLEDIRSVLPGEELVQMDDGSGWEHSFSPSANAGRPVSESRRGETKQAIREKLVEAVDSCTRDRDDIACTLSGGVDSSTIAAIAARDLGKKVSTFTLVFDDKQIDESAYAAKVAQRIGSTHNEVLLRQNNFEESLDWILGSLDLPTSDGINSLLIGRAIAAQGHSMALVGVGSDELFGGHECMRRVPRGLALQACLHHLPKRLRQFAISSAAALLGIRDAAWLPSHGLRGKLLALFEAGPDVLNTYLLSRRVLLQGAVASMFPRVDIESFAGLPPHALARIPDSFYDLPVKTQVSHLEQLIYLRNQLLRDMQMIGVSAGLEIRAPFVDDDLVSAVHSMPSDILFGGKRPKQFLIDCVRDVLPMEAYKRPKLGFVLPIGNWLGGAISSRFEAFTTLAELIDYVGVDLPAMRRIMSDCSESRGRVFYTREWSIFVLLDWIYRNIVSVQAPRSVGMSR